MIKPRLFVCGGAKASSRDPLTADRIQIHLNSIGSKSNVTIRFENVARILGQHLSPRLVDLLEIAAYIYSADCATRRGIAWTDDDSTEPWGRDLAFVIPVRDHVFWNSEGISSLLQELLSFLSDDRWSFRFEPLKKDRTEQGYLQFGAFKNWPFHAPERVLMFSGGLDSLAGVVETAKAGANLVLVSHRPVTTIDSRQRKLFAELQRAFPKTLIHIPVWINKRETFSRESTQRTRSLLYAALGTVVAHSVQAGGVRFFENGIVSLNLPMADEVLRSRASRTTHPITLHLLQSLCAAVVGGDFAVDNPYCFKTKTEVVQIISRCGLAELIPHTCSCAHSIFKPKTQWHCGTCSQCIDRRFAIEAAGLEAHDQSTDYVSDVFVGPRRDGPEKNMAVDYTRHGIELARRSESELMMRFNAELSRAVRHEGNRNIFAHEFVSMHKRHGETVVRVLNAKVSEWAPDIVNRALEPSSLLALAIGADAPQLDSRNQGLRSPSGPLERAKLAEEIANHLFDRIGRPMEKRRASRPKKIDKREAVLFAANAMGLRGPKYCAFLHERELRPKWADQGPATTYPKSYALGGTWRKRIQDEKSRASTRMKNYHESELRDAFNRYLSDKFDEICVLINSRNSRSASTVSAAQQHA